MAMLRTDDGVNLYYEEAGSGTPIVFVHEYAGDIRSWEAQLRHFSRRYRCIAFNARGYPPSDVPVAVDSYSQARARDDILAVLDGVPVSAHPWLSRHLVVDDIFEVNVTPNRPDALSHAGTAREVGAHFGVPVHLPAIEDFAGSGTPIPVDVQIADSIACPRYVARFVTGLSVEPSPLAMRLPCSPPSARRGSANKAAPRLR